jgi:hypothetical protein
MRAMAAGAQFSRFPARSRSKEIMTPELFAKLTLLKQIIGQMSISEKMAFVAEVTSKLPPEALKTSDGQHAYSEENLLAVGLLTLVADNRDEFERIGGFYGAGYRSELRKGLYHGKGEIPSKDWQREIRRLYHLIKANSAGLKLPELREYPRRDLRDPQRDPHQREEVGSGAWAESKYELAY